MNFENVSRILKHLENWENFDYDAGNFENVPQNSEIFRELSKMIKDFLKMFQ